MRRYLVIFFIISLAVLLVGCSSTQVVKDGTEQAVTQEPNNQDQQPDQQQDAPAEDKIFIGYFKNPDYSNPDLFLQTGEQTKAREKILDLAEKINDNKNLSTIKEIFNIVNTIPMVTEGEKFALTADQIIDRGLTGCTDRGLVFAAISRAKGIPTVSVHTARIDWMDDKYNNRTESNFYRGHNLVEVYIDNQWYLIDSSSGKIFLDYDKSNLSLSDGYYVFAKSVEVYDIGAKNGREYTNLMDQVFNNVNPTKYQDPGYKYIDIHDDRIKKSVYDPVEDSYKVIWIEGVGEIINVHFDLLGIIATRESGEVFGSLGYATNAEGISQQVFLQNTDKYQDYDLVFLRTSSENYDPTLSNFGFPSQPPNVGEVYKKIVNGKMRLIITGKDQAQLTELIKNLDPKLLVVE